MLMRTVWFALACLTGLAGASVAMSLSRQTRVEPSVAPKQQLTDVDNISSTEPPAPKGDRLDRIAAPATIPVQTVKVVPQEAREQAQTPAKPEVTSWHWHEGAKVVKRK